MIVINVVWGRDNVRYFFGLPSIQKNEKNDFSLNFNISYNPRIILVKMAIPVLIYLNVFGFGPKSYLTALIFTIAIYATIKNLIKSLDMLIAVAFVITISLSIFSSHFLNIMKYEEVYFLLIKLIEYLVFIFVWLVMVKLQLVKKYRVIELIPKFNISSKEINNSSPIIIISLFSLIFLFFLGSICSGYIDKYFFHNEYIGIDYRVIPPKNNSSQK